MRTIRKHRSAYSFVSILLLLALYACALAARAEDSGGMTNPDSEFSAYGIIPLRVAVQQRSSGPILPGCPSCNCKIMESSGVEVRLVSDAYAAVKDQGYDLALVRGLHSEYEGRLPNMRKQNNATQSEDIGIFVIDGSHRSLTDTWINLNDTNACSILKEFFKKQSGLRNFLRLRNLISPLNDRVQVTEYGGQNQEITDRIVNLELRNNFKQDLFVSIFETSPSGEVTLLYPTPTGPLGPIFVVPSSESIPSSGKKVIPLAVTTPNKSHLKFIVSTQPAELGFLDTEKRWTSRFTPNNPLSYFLAREIAKMNYHSDMGEVPAPDSWTTFSFDLSSSH